LAIEEQPREDLLRDAVAYPRRLKMRMRRSIPQAAAVGDFAELFAGARGDGSWCLYFDEDPVIQFTPLGSVRRLFVANRKYRVTDEGKLLELTRASRGGRVELKHIAVAAEAELLVWKHCLECMQNAVAAIEFDGCEVVGQVPIDETRLLADLLGFLKHHGLSSVQMHKVRDLR
jgi:hypothetical protein